MRYRCLKTLISFDLPPCEDIKRIVVMRKVELIAEGAGPREGSATNVLAGRVVSMEWGASVLVPILYILITYLRDGFSG